MNNVHWTLAEEYKQIEKNCNHNSGRFKEATIIITTAETAVVVVIDVNDAMIIIL